LGDKITAYENQRLNEQVQKELDDQRQTLLKTHQTNAQLQHELEESEGFIDVLQRALSRRRNMFASLLAAFLLSLAIIIAVKYFSKQH